MAALSLAALLALSAAAAPPSERESVSPAENAELAAAWRRDLAQLESARDLAGFLQKQPVEILTDEVVAGGSAVYQDGRVRVSRPVVAGVMRGYEAKGLRGPALIEATAWALADVVAHEIEHAKNRLTFERVIGLPYDYTDRDDELHAMVREIRVLREMRRRFPERMGEDVIDRRREQVDFYLSLKTIPELEQLMDRVFPHAPLLREEDREGLREWARKGAEEEDARHRRELARMSPRLAAEVQAMIRRDAAEIAHVRDQFSRIAALADNPRSFAASKSYWQALYVTLQKRWPEWSR